jgi:membrane fusion protein, multidrug efflux system
MNAQLGRIQEHRSEEYARLRTRARIVAAVLAAIFLAIVIVEALSRVAEHRALGKETEVLARTTVAVIRPKREPAQQELVLPSTLQAYTESPIYARTNGYLSKWYHDIGSRVKKGELLAQIETPEIDQELMQARASREQATAQMEIAKTSAQRWEALRKMDAVAQQETDERASGYAQAQANLAAALANVRRLEQLESFKFVYAPFSGVVIKRNVDIGSLINAGNTGSNTELFDIARTDPIRVYVSVPEVYAASVHPGVRARIEINSSAEKHFSGDVVRNADAIDPATRTLLTEIDVPNVKGELLPGAYAQVHFQLQTQRPTLSLPVNALLFRGEGVRAAVVERNGTIRLQPVTLGRDYGLEVEVIAGLKETDAIVLNPSDSLEEGQQVAVHENSSDR